MRESRTAVDGDHGKLNAGSAEYLVVQINVRVWTMPERGAT
jgi:hypothetical protein